MTICRFHKKGLTDWTENGNNSTEIRILLSAVFEFNI